MDKVQQERQNQFAELVEGLGGKYFYYAHNTEGVFTYVSASVEEILGYDPEEFKRNLESFLPDTPLNRAAIAHTEGSIRGEQQPIYEIEALHKDGSTRRIEAFERPVLDDQGQVVGVEGMSCDITNRIAEGERFARLLDSAPDGMIISDDQGKITLVNARIEDMFGYQRDELIGQAVEILMPKNFRDDHPKLRDGFVADSHIRPMGIGRDLVAQRKDGSVFPVEISLSPVQTEDGLLVSAAVRDITERLQQEEQFRVVFNTSRDAYFFQDDNGFIDCNESTVRMLGYDNKAQIIGLNVLDISADMQLGGVSALDKSRAVIAVAKSEGFNRFEWLLKKKSGEIFPVEVTLSQVQLGGKWILFAVAHDLTERKRAEDALSESENRLNLAMETSDVGLWDFNTQTGETYLNPQYFRMLGYGPKELPHGYETWQKLLHPDDRERAAEKFGQFVSSGNGHEIYEDEYRMVTKAGEERWILARGGVVERDAQNNPVRMIGTHVDITERIHSQRVLAHLVDQQKASIEVGSAVLSIRDQNDLEEVLRTFDHELRKLSIQFRSISIHRLVDEETKVFDSYVFIDASKLERFNRRLPRSYELWQAGELVYLNSREMVIESTSEELHKSLSERHGYGIESILDVPHTRGTLTLLSDRPQAFSPEDIELVKNIVSTISVGISRIEDLERIESRNQDLMVARDEAEKAAREAEAANQAKSIFLANMSHEIRTPMNAILGFSEILGSLLQDPQHKTYLDSIQSSGKALLTLINDILDLSKVEAGKLELELAPIEAKAVFEDMRSIFSQQVEEKEIDFLIDVDANLPDVLILDEARVRQVLINVIGNAIKFTDQGQVTLKVCGTKSHGNHVNLAMEIIDTGVGIPEDQQDKIFGAFEQRAGQSINQYGGTGLGLAITKRLVEMMNGEIGVTSGFGVGSTFTITLNDAEIAAADAVAIQEQSVIDVDAVSFERATLLVTDDIEVNRELIRGYLLPYGFTLLEAPDGQVAMDLMHKHKPDLTLMDIKMPVLDGYTATKLIRKDPALQDLTVVALTASAMRETEEEIGLICDGFLKKPVSKEELVAELIKHLPHQVVDEEAMESDDSQKTDSVALSGEALKKLPVLIEQLKVHQEMSDHLVQTQTINEVEDFAQSMQTLGQENAYSPLIQWGEQLLLHATTFDLNNMSQMLENYGRLIEEAQGYLSSDNKDDMPSGDLKTLLVHLDDENETWEKLCETLTINEVEDFAQRMQAMGQEYGYAPLVDWGTKLIEQASLFDMDNMAKTLGQYAELVEDIRSRLS